MPIDPTDLGLALGIAHASKDAITEVVKRLVCPALDVIGEKVAASVRGYFERRAERAVKMLTDGTQMVIDAELLPQEVPGRILMPILEHGSMEDDEELARRWAALLANAASPGPANKILPAYAEILRQLTPIQARILSWMYEFKTEFLPDTWVWKDIDRKQIENHFGLPPKDFALLISDLERLQLIEPRRDIKSTEENIDGDEMWTLIMARWNSRVKYDSIGFTTLGVRFIEACTPPKKSTVA